MRLALGLKAEEKRNSGGDSGNDKKTVLVRSHKRSHLIYEQKIKKLQEQLNKSSKLYKMWNNKDMIISK